MSDSQMLENQELSEDLKNKVHNWLNEEGWKLKAVSSPEFCWAFVAENSAGFKVNIAQQEDKKDQFLVRVGCNIRDAQSHLASLSEDELEEFIWDMRFELLRSGVDFEGVGSPLQKVSIYRRIYADGLNKSSFVETVQKVMRAVLIVTWMLRRKFGNALPESPSPWVH